MNEIVSKVVKNIKSEYYYFREKPKPLIFDHLPKCAGTTVYTFLRKYYPYRLTYKSGVTTENVERFKNFNKKKRKHFQFVSGHLADLLVDYVRQDALAAIVFREPIDRIISHYYYVKRTKDHYLYQEVFGDYKISLKEYCSKVDNEELRNFYVRRYSGMDVSTIKSNPDEAVKVAFNTINEKYGLVGFKDKIPEFMERLIEMVDLPKGSFVNETVNKTVDRKSLRNIDSDTINAIKKYNTLDIQLYNQLRERFG